MMLQLERISYLLLLALIVWLPIPLASNRIWAWSIVVILVSIQSILLMLSYTPKQRRFPIEVMKSFLWLFVPLTCFQLWTLFQVIPFGFSSLEWVSPKAVDIYRLVGDVGYVSLDRHATKTALIKGVTYTLFAFNAALLITDLGKLLKVVVAIVASGTLQAFYSAIMVLQGWDYSLIFSFRESGPATGSFVYKNHLANYLLICLSMGLGLIIGQMHTTPSGGWNERLKRWCEGVISPKMIVRLSLLIMVIALVMTRSRMGNAAFFIATVLGGMVAFAFFKHRPRAFVPFFGSLFLIDVIVVGAIFGLDKVKSRLGQTSILKETRDEVLHWSLTVVENFPITGTGLGSFYSIFPQYAKWNIGFYDHAHNDYLQFVIEAGIPATLMLGGMLLWAIGMSVGVMANRNSCTLRGLSLGCLIAMIGMLMHISVDFHFQSPANTMTFIIVLVVVGCTRSLKIKSGNDSITLTKDR